MAKKQTYFGVFTTKDVGKENEKQIYFRLHVPSGFLNDTEITGPKSNLLFSGRDNGDVNWKDSAFMAYGDGFPKQCNFVLSPNPEVYRLYVREILIQVSNQEMLKIVEGPKFLTVGKQWFGSALANMFLQ